MIFLLRASFNTILVYKHTRVTLIFSNNC